MATTIAMLRELPVGSQIKTVPGMISNIQAAYHNQGTSKNTGKAYDFWSQRATFKDTAGESCMVEFSPKDGEHIFTAADENRTVTLDVRTDEYNGEFRLRAMMIQPLQAVRQSPQAARQSSPAAKPEVDWDAKDKRTARMNGTNNATQLMILLAGTKKLEPTLDNVLDMAEAIVGYIYEGRQTVSEPTQPQDEVDMPTGDDIPF